MKKLIKVSLLAGIAAFGLFFAACNNTENKAPGMENHQQGDNKDIYACPMHPEITGKKGDKCPKCGMDLVLVPSDNLAKAVVTLNTLPQTIEAGTPVKLMFAFKEKDHNVPLEISHEMKVHLMVVNEDLTWFRHIHPEEQADSSYVVSATFPHGGKYFLFADFKPQGAASTVDKKEIAVKGSAGNDKADYSNKLVSVADGYTVTLENGNDLKTNRAQALEISVKKDGKSLAETDIEPYLGASAHIAMISKDDKDFLHIHPVSGRHFPVYAETHIKKPGIYRVWVEFQINGKVRTADFTVSVKEGEAVTESPSHDHNGHQH